MTIILASSEPDPALQHENFQKLYDVALSAAQSAPFIEKSQTREQTYKSCALVMKGEVVKYNIQLKLYPQIGQLEVEVTDDFMFGDRWHFGFHRDLPGEVVGGYSSQDPCSDTHRQMHALSAELAKCVTDFLAQLNQEGQSVVSQEKEVFHPVCIPPQFNWGETYLDLFYVVSHMLRPFGEYFGPAYGNVVKLKMHANAVLPLDNHNTKTAETVKFSPDPHAHGSARDFKVTLGSHLRDFPKHSLHHVFSVYENDNETWSYQFSIGLNTYGRVEFTSFYAAHPKFMEEVGGVNEARIWFDRMVLQCLGMLRAYKSQPSLEE